MYCPIHPGDIPNASQATTIVPLHASLMELSQRLCQVRSTTSICRWKLGSEMFKLPTGWD